jgi:hypothetical protein
MLSDVCREFIDSLPGTINRSAPVGIFVPYLIKPINHSAVRRCAATQKRTKYDAERAHGNDSRRMREFGHWNLSYYQV